MTSEKPVNRGAVAGTLVVAAIVLCAGLGFGIGSLFGAAAVLGIAGVFGGIVAGVALVYARFRDL